MQLKQAVFFANFEKYLEAGFLSRGRDRGAVVLLYPSTDLLIKTGYNFYEFMIDCYYARRFNELYDLDIQYEECLDFSG